MADRLNFTACLLAGLGWMASGAALAQSALPLADPMRPPPGYVPAGEGDAMPVGPSLESVMLPKHGRPLAVINGRQVRVGDEYEGSRLIRLTEREAVLSGPGGTERLFLTPGIRKEGVSAQGDATQRVTVAPTAQKRSQP